MVKDRIESEENLDIPLEGEGWFDHDRLPEDIRSYQYCIYFRYTNDDETITKDEVASSKLLPNRGPIINEGYSLNIFIRDDIDPEKKKIAFLHELYESYYIHSLRIDQKEAHKKAQELYSFKSGN